MENLKNYESVIIINKNNYEATLEQVKERFNQFEGLKYDELGIKKLAYEVQKQKEANYVVIYFKAIENDIRELERFCRITDDILKFIFVKIED